MKASPVTKIKDFEREPENLVTRKLVMKAFLNKKMIDSKLIKTDIKLDLLAFVEVTRANKTEHVFYCFIQSRYESRCFGICEFRLCITLAEWQRNKAIGLSPNPSSKHIS